MDELIEEKDNITKYHEVMERYHNGEFGDEHLTLYEILILSGESELLKVITIEELDQLIEESTGTARQLFATLKARRLEEQESPMVKRLKPKSND